MRECNIFLNCFLLVSLVISVWTYTSVSLCDESVLRSNYLPLHFHHVHGENIKLTKNRTVATRFYSFRRGIVFSDRTVMTCEPVYVKLLETTKDWGRTVRIGFTMNDPESFKCKKLPDDVHSPDVHSRFTSKDGNWAKALGLKHSLVKEGSVLHYYVDRNGDVHYGIDSEEYGILFGGVNTSGRLWAVIDVYGRTVAVEFVGDIEKVDGYATDSTDVSFETTTEWYSTETDTDRYTTEQETINISYDPEMDDDASEIVPYKPDELHDYATKNVLYSPGTDWYATETSSYITETDWDSSETQSISLFQRPLTNPVSGPVVSTVKPTAVYFDETGKPVYFDETGKPVYFDETGKPVYFDETSRLNSHAGSVVLSFSNSQTARETSPVSNTDRDPKYLPASSRSYVDISINFPFGQRWPAPNTPLPIDRRLTQNQGMGSVPDYLKSKPSSAQFQWGYDRFSVDTQDRNVRESDEELSSRYADESYTQTDYVPKPLIALFLFPNSYPINIRVNG